MNPAKTTQIVCKALPIHGTSKDMTKPTTFKLAMVLFTTLALGGCGTDPYSGDSTAFDASAAVTETATNTATKTVTTTITTTATDTSIVGPDAGSPDVPSAPASGVYDMYVSVAPVRQLDLVFMIDNSPSMAPKQAKLNAQFPKLIDALKNPNDGTLPDLRVAIIDSDLGTGGAYDNGPCGPNLNNGWSNYGDQGHFRMINGKACGMSDDSQRWIEYTKGFPVNYTGDINNVFGCLAGGLGTLGCGEEHSLQAFEFALVAAGVGNDQQQKDFLRPTAYLGLVFLSDEDDCSAALNDGMFGDLDSLKWESASLRCATRAHKCNGQNLTVTPPGYPTTAAFSTALTNCEARLDKDGQTPDSCPNQTDGSNYTDTSVPTACNPLKSIRRLAAEIKSLKSNPDEQIFVAGIFGFPTASADWSTARYKIDLIPNPNTQDISHPQIYDYWPICYDPSHVPANPNVYDTTAASWGATGGLRMSAFIDQFGTNGLKSSICEADFTGAMQKIGQAMAGKMQNLCVPYKLLDTDLPTPGLQPSCTVNYMIPTVDPNNTVILVESAPLPQCPAGALNGTVAQDCWQLTSDSNRCLINGQLVNTLRTANEIASVPLTPGTTIHMQCQVCDDADTRPGCSSY
jgi:hypothetical protein